MTNSKKLLNPSTPPRIRDITRSRRLRIRSTLGQLVDSGHVDQGERVLFQSLLAPLEMIGQPARSIWSLLRPIFLFQVTVKTGNISQDRLDHATFVGVTHRIGTDGTRTAVE